MNTIAASFANSDGCRRSGPRSIQREDPARTVPMPRTNTATSARTVQSRNGTAARRHSRSGRRLATTNPAAPRPIHNPWWAKADQAEPSSAIDSADDESTITRPRTQNPTTRAVSAVASRRATKIAGRGCGRAGAKVAWVASTPLRGAAAVPPTRRSRVAPGCSRPAGRGAARRSMTPVVMVRPPPGGRRPGPPARARRP